MLILNMFKNAKSEIDVREKDMPSAAWKQLSSSTLSGGGWALGE